ncbi:MAG: EF-hand domain-containing protein [Desulfobacterales bacterium]
MRLRITSLIVLSTVLISSCFGKALSLPSYSEMDRDGDGQVVWREFHQGLPSLSPKAFLEADLNKNGYVTPDEWTSWSAP